MRSDGIQAPSRGYAALRRLWSEHRITRFPPPGPRDSRLQEVTLYESWLGGIVETSLARGGRLSPGHRRMLDMRRAEGSAALWSLAAELGEPLRSYVARLMAIEDLLTALPDQ